MNCYQRLTPEERYQIEALKESGSSIRSMARFLKRSASTVSRELRRNSGKSYRPQEAQKMALERRANIGPPRKVQGLYVDLLADGLHRQWSPVQISKRLAREGISLSHETIYRYIYQDFKQDGYLFEYLRKRRKFRRSHQASRNFKNVGKRKYQNWIDLRPEIVEKRSRLGDFERDTVLGKFGGPLLLTIVDRTSRLTKICRLDRLNAMLTHEATVKLLGAYKIETITNDNGPEFAEFQFTEKALNTRVYFNHPYSSWQRGTNENTNGLIRQFYPKGTDFSQISDETIYELEELLNNRPRKCLGFKTPLEVHTELSQGVALRC